MNLMKGKTSDPHQKKVEVRVECDPSVWERLVMINHSPH